MDPREIDNFPRPEQSETMAQNWLVERESGQHRLDPKVKTEVGVDISAHVREGLPTWELDLAIPPGPISEFTLVNVKSPAFDRAR